MAQVTWRAPDVLVERIRAVAAREHRSMNEYLTRVMEAVVDPDLAGDDAARVRERLARAGLLVAPDVPRQRPGDRRLETARRAAGSGTQLADLVSDDRR